MGGLVIAQEVARQLGCRFIFVEKEAGRLVLRRGFRITPGEKILLIEDVITRGGRVQETLDIVKKKGGSVQALGVLVDRSQGRFQPGVPLVSLIEMEMEVFDPKNLPEDLKNSPALKPGS